MNHIIQVYFACMVKLHSTLRVAYVALPEWNSPGDLPDTLLICNKYIPTWETLDLTILQEI